MTKTTLFTGIAKSSLFFGIIMMACLMAAAPSWSAEDWKASFDDICSKVETSGSLSAEELAALIERVDKLVPEIKASTDPSKKIYLQRLKRCRSMFEFMIETMKNSEPTL